MDQSPGLGKRQSSSFSVEHQTKTENAPYIRREYAIDLVKLPEGFDASQDDADDKLTDLIKAHVKDKKYCECKWHERCDNCNGKWMATKASPKTFH